MSDETPPEKGKKKDRKPPAVGSIAQLMGAFGGGESTESSDVQTARPSDVQNVKMPEVEQSKSSDKEQVKMPGVQTLEKPKSKQEASRRQKTVYLSPHLAHWLNIQAAQEEREISEIVEDALKLYRDQL